MATSKQPKRIPVVAARSAAKATSPARRRSAKAVKKLPPSPQDAIRAELETIVDDPGLWLDSPNPLFGGRTPGELIGTEHEILVREWIGSVKHGMFS
jgi:hypothetical protein